MGHHLGSTSNIVPLKRLAQQVSDRTAGQRQVDELPAVLDTARGLNLTHIADNIRHKPPVSVWKVRV